MKVEDMEVELDPSALDWTAYGTILGSYRPLLLLVLVLVPW